MGGHNGAAAHNSKVVLSVFIQSKAKNQKDKTHSRGIKPAGKNLKPRKEGTKVKTQRTRESDKKRSTVVYSENQANWQQGKGKPG